jgi:hypothetical protein
LAATNEYQIKDECYLLLELHMSEEDLELLITLDDPEDPEKEDTFHHLEAENTVAHWPDQPQQGGDPTGKQK